MNPSRMSNRIQNLCELLRLHRIRSTEPHRGWLRPNLPGHGRTASQATAALPGE